MGFVVFDSGISCGKMFGKTCSHENLFMLFLVIIAYLFGFRKVYMRAPCKKTDHDGFFLTAETVVANIEGTALATRNTGLICG